MDTFRRRIPVVDNFDGVAPENTLSEHSFDKIRRAALCLFRLLAVCVFCSVIEIHFCHDRFPHPQGWYALFEGLVRGAVVNLGEREAR